MKYFYVLKCNQFCPEVIWYVLLDIICVNLPANLLFTRTLTKSERAPAKGLSL